MSEKDELCPNTPNDGEQTPSTSAGIIPFIRFPAPPRVVIRCCWFQCDVEFPTTLKLVDHLQIAHVDPQLNNDVFLCLWLGCKVHAQPSVSKDWMEHHVLHHGAKNPFVCKVAGCGKLFSTKNLLKTHAERHSNGDKGKGKQGCKGGESKDTDKLQLHKHKKLQNRQPPSKDKTVDHIDTGMVEGMMNRLLTFSGQQKPLGNPPRATLNARLSWDCKHFVVNSQVMARRVLSDGTVEWLVHWIPDNVLPDEWVLQSELKTSQLVPLSRLSPRAVMRLHDSLFPPKSARRPRKDSRLQQQPPRV